MTNYEDRDRYYPPTHEEEVAMGLVENTKAYCNASEFFGFVASYANDYQGFISDEELPVQKETLAEVENYITNCAEADEDYLGHLAAVDITMNWVEEKVEEIKQTEIPTDNDYFKAAEIVKRRATEASQENNKDRTEKLAEANDILKSQSVGIIKNDNPEIFLCLR